MSTLDELTETIDQLRIMRNEIIAELRLMDHLQYGNQQRIQQQRDQLTRRKVALAVAGRILLNTVALLRKQQQEAAYVQG